MKKIHFLIKSKILKIFINEINRQIIHRYVCIHTMYMYCNEKSGISISQHFRETFHFKNINELMFYLILSIYIKIHSHLWKNPANV